MNKNFNQLNIFFKATLTVDAMRNKLDAILNLVNVWVQLNEEKTRYENTQMCR